MQKNKGVVITMIVTLLKHPRLRSLIWGCLYDCIVRFYSSRSWVFMNYGFKNLEESYMKLQLAEKDEPNRYFIQLYEYILGNKSLADKHVLEVGSGRGGGTSYLHRYHKPLLSIGLDRSKHAVRFCLRHHRHNGLTYRVGNAVDLPFPENSFDAVVNVESSHCYNTREKFFHEVKRVLKPGGMLFYTDALDSDRLPMLKQEIAGTRLRVVKEEDISKNVISALEEDGERRYTMFKKTMNPLVLHYFKEFAGNKTSEFYRKITSGVSVYYHYILEKAHA